MIGDCAGCHKVNSPDGVALCDSCASEAETYFRMTPEEEEECWAEEKKYRRRRKWEAFRTLFKPSSWENKGWFQVRMVFICAVAILLGRVYRDGQKYKSYQYEDVAHWDYNRTYAGYDVQVVGVCPRAWRFIVYGDGEWNM